MCCKERDNYFFALPKYQKPLEEILSQNPRFVQPLYHLNEVQSWIKSGLKDFSISRALVDRGIPVPDDNKQTIYVWFDALLGKDCFSLARPSLSCQSREGIPSNPDTSLVYQIYLSRDKRIMNEGSIFELFPSLGKYLHKKGQKGYATEPSDEDTREGHTEVTKTQEKTQEGPITRAKAKELSIGPSSKHEAQQVEEDHVIKIPEVTGPITRARKDKLREEFNISIQALLDTAEDVPDNGPAIDQTAMTSRPSQVRFVFNYFCLLAGDMASA